MALAGLVIWLTMRGEGIDWGGLVRTNINWGWVVGAILLVYVVAGFNILQMWAIMRVTTGKGNWRLATEANFLERFWTMMTPFMSGGRPYQVYHLHKSGLSMGKTTSIVVSNFIVGRIGFQITNGLVLAFLLFRVGELDGGNVVTSTIIIGIVYAVLLTTGFILMAFTRFVPDKAAKLSVYLLFKVKIIKNKKRANDAMSETLWTYRVAMRKLRRRPFIFAGTTLLHAFGYFLHLFKIVFIYAAIWGFPDAGTIGLLLLGIALVENTAAFVPLPGGTGGMEIFFLSIFATLFGGAEVVVAVVLWKIVSYVIHMLNGLPVIMYDSWKRKPVKQGISPPEAEHTSA